jgi:hypothetical protein
LGVDAERVNAIAGLAAHAETGEKNAREMRAMRHGIS